MLFVLSVTWNKRALKPNKKNRHLRCEATSKRLCYNKTAVLKDPLFVRIRVLLSRTDFIDAPRCTLCWSRRTFIFSPSAYYKNLWPLQGTCTCEASYVLPWPQDEMKTAHNFKDDHLCPRCASAVSDVHCLEYGMVFISRDSLHCIITILESHPTRRKYGFTIRGSWIRIRCIVGTCTGCSYGLIQPTELEWTSNKLLDNQHSTFCFSNTWVFSKGAHSHSGVARQDAKSLNGIMRD